MAQTETDRMQGPTPDATTSGEAAPTSAPLRPRLRRALGENLPPVAAAVTLLAAWQLAVPAFDVPAFVLPTPLAIAERMASEWSTLLQHTWVSLGEVVYGFGLSILLGLPLALAIFYWRAFEKTAYPFLVTLQTIPKVALAPILVMWFGHQLAPKVLVAFLISFFPIVIATLVGLRSIDKDMVHLVRSMGANEWDTFRRVRLPAALPNVFGGLKVGIGLAVVGAIIGEYVASDSGLGYLQLAATARFDTVLNFAALTMISLMGVVLFFVVVALERVMVPWHASQDGSE